MNSLIRLWLPILPLCMLATVQAQSDFDEADSFEAEIFGFEESGSFESGSYEAGSWEAGSVESGSSLAGGPTALRNRKQQVTKLATSLIMLIAFTGLFLILWVMIYGRYLKNRVKIRSCEIEPPEEFWYLKHKPPEQDPTEPDSPQDDKSPQEDQN